MDSPPPRRRGPGRSRADADGAGGLAVARLTGDGRGQSVALEYALSLAVASLVVTGLFLAAGDFVTDQREQVVRTELGVVGEQLAGEVVAADRLVRASESTQRLSLNTSLPSSVAGSGYTIEVGDTGSSQWLNLTTRNPDVSVSVRLRTETDLDTGSVDGGRVGVVYDPSADRLEVRG